MVFAINAPSNQSVIDFQNKARGTVASGSGTPSGVSGPSGGLSGSATAVGVNGTGTASGADSTPTSSAISTSMNVGLTAVLAVVGVFILAL